MTIEQLKGRWNQGLLYRGRCRRCESQWVWHNGIRLRTASLRQGEQTVFVDDIPVRRLCWGDCKARWSHAPEGITSRAHYQPSVVAEAVASDVLDEHSCDAQVAQEYGCHQRTLLRWVQRVAEIAQPAHLMGLLLQESDAAVIPAVPPVIRRRRSAKLMQLGQRAVLVLALLEALASTRGLCPPGLGHVAQLLPAVGTQFMPAVVASSEAAM